MRFFIVLFMQMLAYSSDFKGYSLLHVCCGLPEINFVIKHKVRF